jgi:hypothetical protein
LCVAEGKFKILDPDRHWIYQPKAPIEILCERGRIVAQREQPIPPEYTKEMVGKLILGMPNHRLLLLELAWREDCATRPGVRRMLASSHIVDVKWQNLDVLSTSACITPGVQKRLPKDGCKSIT